MELGETKRDDKPKRQKRERNYERLTFLKFLTFLLAGLSVVIEYVVLGC